MAAEPAVQIVGLRQLPQLLRDLHEHVLARERADLLLDLAEFVGPNVGQRADAVVAGRIEAVGQNLEETPAVVEPRHRVLVHGLLDELLGLARFDRRRARHAQLHGGVAVDRRRVECQLERQLFAGGCRRGDFQQAAWSTARGRTPRARL